MMKHAEVKLTGREAEEVQSLLSAVLMNADQWDSYDMAALGRANDKLNAAIRKAGAA